MESANGNKGHKAKPGSSNLEKGQCSVSNLTQKSSHVGNPLNGQIAKISTVSSNKSVIIADAAEDCQDGLEKFDSMNPMKYDPSARRSEVRKLHRRRRSSRTRSREKYHFHTCSNQCLVEDQTADCKPNRFIADKQDSEERFVYGDTYTDGAGKQELNRVSQGEIIDPGEKLSTQVIQPAKPSEGEITAPGPERSSGWEVFQNPNDELASTIDPLNSTHKTDSFKRKTSGDTYTDIYMRKHVTTTISHSNLDQFDQSKTRKLRLTLKRKLSDKEIKWRTIPELQKENAPVDTEDVKISTGAREESDQIEPKADEAEDVTIIPDEGLPFNTYLENYLNQNMDFLHAYLRSPAEVIAGTRESSGPVTRLTVTPKPPPEIGYTERRKPPEVSPASSFHELEILPRTKVDELKIMSKLSSAKESFRKFVQLQRQSLSHAISSQQNFLHKTFRTDEDKRPFWKSKFLEQNRMENKVKSKTYAITLGWELKRRNIRPINKTLISNLLKLRNSKKYKAAMRHNPWRRKEKISVPAHVIEEYNYLLNEYNKSYAGDLMPPLLKNSETFAGLPVDRPLLDDPPYTDFNSANIYPETPSYLSGSKPAVSAYNSWKSKKFSKYDQHNPVTSILEDSSKVSEKTQALLQASGGKSPIILPHARPKANSPFNPDALLKIYSPKTDFTRQFSDLLPNSGLRKS